MTNPMLCYAIVNITANSTRHRFRVHFGIDFGIIFGTVLAPFWGPFWYHFWGSKGEPKFNSFLDPSRTPRELSTPIVYNPHFALQPSLLLKDLDDFIVLLIKPHFENTNFVVYVRRFRPYPRSTSATKKSPESTDDCDYKIEVHKSEMYCFT